MFGIALGYEDINDHDELRREGQRKTTWVATQRNGVENVT